MDSTNIILAGVGGQGLVLATKIIADAANNAGIDVKTNDVVGLSQRGGRVWGSVKIGKKVYSPNINPQEADILIASEKLEARRFRKSLKPGDSVAIINDYEMVPTLVQQGEAEYSQDVLEEVEKYAKEAILFDATQKATDLGNKAAANIILLGIAARYLDIPEDAWVEAVKSNVPPKFVELNLKAFLGAFRNEF